MPPSHRPDRFENPRRWIQSYFSISFILLTSAGSNLNSFLTCFSISAPSIGSRSSLAFCVSAKNSGSFIVSMKALRNKFTRSFGVAGGKT